MTSTTLPTYVGTASASWQLVDWQLPTWTSQPATGGRATIECPQLAPDELWLIDRAVAYCSSTTATRLRLYDSAVDPSRLPSGSASGNFDEADYPAGLVLRPSTSLIAQWTGCSDGALATLTLQVRQLRRA